MNCKLLTKIAVIVFILIFIFETSPEALRAFAEDCLTNDYNAEESACNNPSYIYGSSSLSGTITELGTDAEPYVIGEMTSLREEDAKHYRMSDGSITMAIFADPIHFEQDGVFIDIDNRLRLDSSDYMKGESLEYRNMANSFDLRLSKDADQNNMVTLSDKEYSISFSSLYDPADYLLQWSANEKTEANGTARSLSSEVTDILPDQSMKDDPYDLQRTSSELIYKDVNPGVDFQYIPTNRGIKENIIVNSPQSSYEYAYALSLTGLNARLTDQNMIELYDERDPGSVKYIFPAPYMFDASGEDSHEVKYELRKVDSFTDLRSGLTPAIEAAGQEAVFSKLDRAISREQNNKEIDAEPTTSVQSDRETSASQGEEETEASIDNVQSFGESSDVSEEETDDATEEIAVPEENIEEDIDALMPNEDLEIDPTEEQAPIEESSFGGALEEKLSEENLYIFTIKADSEWIDNDERVFPITIDPVLERLRSQELAAANCSLTCLHYNSTGSLLSSHSGEWMHVGKTSDKKTCYVVKMNYLNFNDDFENLNITNATFRIQGDNSSVKKQVWLSEPYGYSYDPSPLALDGANNSCHYLIDYADLVASTTPTPNPIATFDATKYFAKAKYYDTSGGINSRPIELYFSHKEQTTTTNRQFRLPQTGAFLTITYTLPYGLEDYWQTHEQNAGRAGTGYINDYAGYLTFVHDDVSTSGTRMPASVQHIYNSNADSPRLLLPLSYTDAGNKWKLNYQQTLTIPVGEADPSVYPYVWTDSDGTKHFLKSTTVTIYENGAARSVTDINGGAEDEDGLGLFVVPVSDATLKTNYPLKITNKSGSFNMYFNKAGDLGLIIDSNQREDGVNSLTKDKNRIEIIYDNLPPAAADDGAWIQLLADVDDYLTKISQVLISDYQNTLKSILQMEKDDQFIRRNKDILTKLNTVKADMIYLIENPTATQQDRQTKLNEAKTAINAAMPLISDCNNLMRKRITSIKDPSDTEILISYYTSGVNEGKIHQITDPTKPTSGGYESITYDYDNNGNLTTITYPLETGALQSKVSSFAYDIDGLITSVTESEGYKIQYTYGECDFWIPPEYSTNKVTGVKEYANSIPGQEYSIRYLPGKTSYTFSGKDDLFSTNIDNIGNTFLFDNSGRTITACSTAGGVFIGGGSFEYVNAADKSKNKIKNTSYSGVHSHNLLKNHSFEIYGAGSNWYKYDNFTSAGSLALFTAAFDTTAAGLYIGAYNAKIAGSSSFSGGTTSSPKIQGYAQQVILPKGEYTYSGYVKTSFLSSGGEAFLRVVDQSQASLINTSSSIATSKVVGPNTLSNLNNGWVRCSVTFTLSAQTNVYVCAEVRNTTAGNAYFDCLQLEKGKVANEYNILENSSFEQGATLSAPWTSTGGSVDQLISLFGFGSTAHEGSYVYSIIGNMSSNLNLSTPLNVGTANANYVFSGWIKFGSMLPAKSDRKVQIEITCPQKNTVYIKPLYVPIEGEWFYFSVPLERANWSGGKISFVLNGIEGKLDIDNLQLVKKDITQSEYTAGNLTKQTTGSSTTTYTYDARDQIATATSPTGAVTTYIYDSITNNVTSIASKSGTVTTTTAFTYDKYGNCISEKTTGNAESIITSCGYTNDGRFLDYSLDSRGNRTDYTYDTDTGFLMNTLSSGNNSGMLTSSFTYDDDGCVTSASAGGKIVTFSYNSRGNLTTVTHNGFDYDLSYDGFGNTTQICAAGQTLASYTYGPTNGKSISNIYSNGFTTEYIYNEKEQVVGEKWTQGGVSIAPGGDNAFDVLYSNDGKLAEYKDNLNNMKYSYDYDAAGRMRRGFAWENGVKQYEFEKIYKDEGQPLSFWYSTYDGSLAAPVEHKYGYTFEADGRPIQTTFPNGSYGKYTYDTLKRVSSYTYNPITTTTNTNVFKTDVTYIAGNTNPGNGGIAGATTELVGTYTNKLGSVTKDSFTYTYNNKGLISMITNNVTGSVKFYKYDALSRLIYDYEGDALNETAIEYDYDAGGNIVETRVVDPLAQPIYMFGVGYVPAPPLSVSNFQYKNTGWKDQLIGYNGQSIVYDAIGNPTTYLGKTLGWERGRKLSSVSWTGNDISYVYSTGGERLSKTVNNYETKYITIGGMLVQEKTFEYDLNYFYDSNGNVISLGLKPKGVAGNPTFYYALQRNAQGDVIAIYTSDANPTLVGTYTYDTWGKVVSIKDDAGVEISGSPYGIMNINPIRYRGYYYDRETGFYFLQSRYYDPEVKRFINADGLISTGQGVTGYNMYVYCNNNPVNCYDPTGMCTYRLGGISGIKVDCGSIYCSSSSKYVKTGGGVQNPTNSTPVPKPAAPAPAPAPTAPTNPVPGSNVGDRMIHNNSIDLVAPEMSQIYAPVGGKIGPVYNPYPNNYNVWKKSGGSAAGNSLYLITWDGSTLLLCHLRQDGITVKEGDIVSPGTPLALVGNTGNSSGAHLHIGVTSGNKSILDYLPKNIMGG